MGDTDGQAAAQEIPVIAVCQLHPGEKAGIAPAFQFLSLPLPQIPEIPGPARPLVAVPRLRSLFLLEQQECPRDPQVWGSPRYGPIA